jgi:hypothetical protein
LICPQFYSELTVIIKVAPINDLNAIYIKTEGLLISEERLQTCQSLRKEARLSSRLKQSFLSAGIYILSAEFSANFNRIIGQTTTHIVIETAQQISMFVSRKVTKNKFNGATQQTTNHNSIYSVKLQGIYVHMPPSSYRLQQSASEMCSHSEATNVINIQCNGLIIKYLIEQIAQIIIHNKFVTEVPLRISTSTRSSSLSSSLMDF